MNSPIPAYGREGCEDYLKLGYVHSDKYKESVSLTLDAAYCDYCLGVVAKILGYKDKAEKYFERSKNYQISLIKKQDLCAENVLTEVLNLILTL